MEKRWVVIVKQLVDTPSDGDDRVDQPAGAYLWSGKDEDEVLDDFHATVPIGCLDDFEVSTYELKDYYKCLGKEVSL